MIKRIFYNKKKLFCYILILISILFSFFSFFIKPKKMNVNYLYDYSDKRIERVNFPLVQHFHASLDNFKIINIYLQDSSLNQYNYKIDVYGEKTGKNYYSHEYIDYNSDILILPLNEIPDSKDDEFVLSINCEMCNDVYMSLKKSKDKNNYIEGDSKGNIIEFTLVNYVTNNNYYWYSIVGVVISLILYPYAKEDIINEKK